LQLPLSVVESGRVVGHDCFLAVPGARGKLVVGDLLFVQHLFDGRLGALWIGEVILERRADQLVARATGQRVDVRFDQRARVELLVAKTLIELLLLFFDLLASGVVRAD
jgi:hypothetical protein